MVNGALRKLRAAVIDSAERSGKRVGAQDLRLILKLTAGAALAMGLLAMIVPVLQRHLMYFPDTMYFTPAQAGLPGVAERVLETPDGARVIAW